MSEIILITGEIGSGKTSFCLKIVEIARAEGIDLAGLISPGLFRDEKKVAIDVHDLRSRQQRRLAVLNIDQDSKIQTKRWAFDPEVTAWGNRVLAKALPCDLLLIDEIGPLELNRDQGWVNGVQVVKEGDFQSALVVIRPSLVIQAQAIWQVARIIDLDHSPVNPLDFYQSLELETRN